MSDHLSQPVRSRATSIADLVFAGEPRARAGRFAVSALAVIGVYAGVFAIVAGLGRTAGPWSAELAARIHEAIAEERAVDVTPPTPPPQPAPPPKESSPIAAPRVAHSAHVSHAAPSAPAQAAQLAAATSAPADFTGLAFVVGTGATYAGGTTTSTGTSQTAVSGDVVPGATGGGARSRARAVSLDQSAWNCPWPPEADAQQVNEQTVVLRAAVGADGHAERVDVVSDPGFGFGAAARRCALSTRFEPALSPAGDPVGFVSPPIRVHFFR